MLSGDLKQESDRNKQESKEKGKQGKRLEKPVGRDRTSGGKRGERPFTEVKDLSQLHVQFP